MTKYKFVSASKCEKAALRLSKFFNLAGIIAYASEVRTPHDLDQLSQLLSKVGLFLRCNQDDLSQCVQYIDMLAADLYAPRTIRQYNHSCQQFYGDIHDSRFDSPKYSRRNPFAA